MPGGRHQHANRQVPQFDKSRIRGLRGQGTDNQRLAGDAFRIVPDSLEFTVGVDRGKNQTQVTPGGLVAHEKLQAQPVQFSLSLVNIQVAENHRVGQAAVPLDQRLHAGLEGALGQPGHQRDFAAQRFDVPL